MKKTLPVALTREGFLLFGEFALRIRRLWFPLDRATVDYSSTPMMTLDALMMA